ncbi:MAG: cytochrome c3 family protein [Planctomycetes bacterium]|nr:cytochrome c3 family protein [Planctomycetota bacterium]
MASRRRTTTLLTLIAVLPAAGCLLMTQLGLLPDPRAFSHKLHGTEQELACSDCHATAETAEKAEKASMPKLRQCRLCHEGIDEEKPPERRVAALYGEAHQWSPPAVLGSEVIFSHKLHVAEKSIACADCHRGIEDSKAVSDRVRVFKDDCMGCHERSGLSNDCAVCHAEVRRDWQPPNHLRLWKELHGQAVRAETGRSAERCSLCHADSTCASCHQDEPPRSHTNHWRHRGHGIAASIDRARCLTCHRDDYCDRCHREVSPRNHTGAWGEPRNRHCLTCHLPLRDEACFACHRSTPGHGGAPGRPENEQHAVATEATCRTCHDVIGIAHPDNGDNCGSCHL